MIERRESDILGPMAQFNFLIEEAFQATGIGTVASGTMREGTLEVGQEVTVFGGGDEPEVVAETLVSAILVERQKVPRVEKGMAAALALRGVPLEALDRHFQITERGGRPEAVAPPIDPTSPFAHLWQGDPTRAFGVALQGGGAKGAFGVGAVSLLAEIGLMTRPRLDHLAGTSTGSLTALVLAECKGTFSAQKARTEYLRLRDRGDMFALREEVVRLGERSPALGRIVEGALGGKLGELSPLDLAAEEYLTYGTLLPFAAGIVTGAPLLGFLLAADDLVDEIEETKAAFDAFLALPRHIAHLDPVRKGLLPLVDMDEVQNSGVSLRLAVVSYDTGAIAYLTENAELLYPTQLEAGQGMDWSNYQVCEVTSINGKHRDAPEVGALSAMMIEGTLASAAIPGVFEPMEIAFEAPDGPRRELFFDGGTRENLPLDIMRIDGAEEIIAIYNKELEPALEPRDAPPTWHDVALRGLGLAFDEVTRTDGAVGEALNRADLGHRDDVPTVVHIAPTTATTSVTEVDPPLIRAVMWYGYMRAYDELFIARRAPRSAGENDAAKALRDSVRANTDRLFQGHKGAIRRVRALVAQAMFHVAGEGFVDLAALLERGTDVKLDRIAFKASRLTAYFRSKRQMLESLRARVDFYAARSLGGGHIHSLPFGRSGAMFLDEVFYSRWSIRLEEHPTDAFAHQWFNIAQLLDRSDHDQPHPTASEVATTGGPVSGGFSLIEADEDSKVAEQRRALIALRREMKAAGFFTLGDR